MSLGADPRLSLTEAMVLALLDEEPRHGFSVARELREEGPIGQVWAVPGPLVYRAIDRLRGLSLIEATATESSSRGPTRTVYGATPAGSFRVRSWLGEPVAHPRDVRAEFIAKLMLTARRGWTHQALVDRQLAHFRPIATGLREKALHATGSDRFVALWRMENIAAITRMLEALSEDADVASRTKAR